jgi:hypothetical protein
MAKKKAKPCRRHDYWFDWGMRKRCIRCGHIKPKPVSETKDPQ